MQKTKLLLNILALFLCILPAVSMAQGGGNVTVSGIVTSADDKQPLIGVNVISGATSGVSTLADGTYRITVSAGTTLTFQYIGYKPFEFTVPAGRSSVTCDVALQGDSQTLDDVVVIAYGVRKKGTIAGSVSTVKAEKIEDTPAAAFDQALQGQVPGLTVLSDSGEPSEAAAMAIRGTNSINSGTAPLYILDGVAISSRDFNTINPSDIESLSVLKDASSTSIYGARAANGVIVITTKRGRMADRAKINYRMQLGFSQIAYGNWDLMNTSERIQYEKELGLTDGKNYNVLAKTDVNWLDEVFSNAALLQNYELSVSGASEKTNYYVSGGYYSQDGTAVGSSFERYSIRANVEQRAAKWLKLGTNTMMNYQTIEKADALVLSDYGKGGLTHITKMIECARAKGCPVLVDPKGDDYERYRGATVITPNRSELRQVVGAWKSEADLLERAQNLRAELDLQYLLLTRSEEGMTLFSDEGAMTVPAQAREVFDVSGAGDTVIAVLATLVAAGVPIPDAVATANRAGGIVVGKLGTASVTYEELFS